jgi:hypothetical protein
MRKFHAEVVCCFHAFRVEICRIVVFLGALDEKKGQKWGFSPVFAQWHYLCLRKRK